MPDSSPPREPTIWMNVTTSSQWTRSPVGIVRVEQEIHRHLKEILGHRLKTVIYDEGSFRSEMKPRRDTAANDADFWPEPSFESSDPFDVFAKASPVRAAQSVEQEAERLFHCGDLLITLGLDWDHPGLHDEIRRLRKVYGLKVITCCYDLIPVLYPQYCVSDVSAWFKTYLVDMTWNSDGVLCISENTRRDYVDLVRSMGLPERRTEVIKLGSSLPQQVGGAEISPEVERLIDSPYFLFVSTIERRKNHEVLYRAYHLLRTEHPDTPLPKLVFVGMQGWGVNELLGDIRLDPLTQKDIVVLPHVSDAELSLLYSKCEAFLYPSLYEGWGLPIAEALQLGRPTLASSAGSIPEVGGDLVRYLDPWSPREWAQELWKIIQGEVDLNEWSARIQKGFQAYEWPAAAGTVISLAKAIAEEAPTKREFEAGYDLPTLHGIKYGDKIVYSGKQGIVSYGPYIALDGGAYETRLNVDLVKGASGHIRLKAAHDHGDKVIVKKTIDISDLKPGGNTIKVGMDLKEAVESWELVCEVDCQQEVRFSVNRLEVERLTGTAAA